MREKAYLRIDFKITKRERDYLEKKADVDCSSMSRIARMALKMYMKKYPISEDKQIAKN